MADCTHTHNRRSHNRALLIAAVCTISSMLAAAGFAAPALADGDPASDVLTSQALFLPSDAGPPASGQAQLEALLAAAQRSGYPIRVAVIASRADLGSITELWRQPQRYAQFLGQELALVYRGPLLVVMPGGFGVYHDNRVPARERSALDRVSAPASSRALGSAALAGVEHLAAAAGHPLALPAAATPVKPSSADPLPWIVLALGAALVVLAWGASFRARPLGRGAPSS